MWGEFLCFEWDLGGGGETSDGVESGERVGGGMGGWAHVSGPQIAL